MPDKEIPEEVKKWLREQGKKGGRPIEYDDEKHEKNRQRVRKHREKLRQKEDEMRDVVKENPELAQKAKQTLANCDWYDEEGNWRADGIPDEDLVIATMLHFAEMINKKAS